MTVVEVLLAAALPLSAAALVSIPWSVLRREKEFLFGRGICWNLGIIPRPDNMKAMRKAICASQKFWRTFR